MHVPAQLIIATRGSPQICELMWSTCMLRHTIMTQGVPILMGLARESLKINSKSQFFDLLNFETRLWTTINIYLAF